MKRKIAALQPIPPAEDTDGNVLLDSDDKEIEGEDPDATKRAVLTARLVPLTAEAARIGKEKKKAATAVHAHLGVKVIASLTRFNSLEMIRITANNYYNSLIALIVNYWEVVNPLADDWSTNLDVAVATFGFQYGDMSYTEQVRYLQAHSYHRNGDAQATETGQMFLLKLDPNGAHHLKSVGARYKDGESHDAFIKGTSLTELAALMDD